MGKFFVDGLVHPMRKKTKNAVPDRMAIMFDRIKDWRRIAMRYDRCAHTFFSALCLAASLIFYLI